MGRLSDTSPEAERVVVESLRRMPFERRWHLMGSLYRTARRLHEAGLRSRRPEVTPEQVRQDWARLHLDRNLLPLLEGRPVIGNDDNLPVLRRVIAVLDDLGIPYALGGSWASSLHGKARMTHDADLSVEPFPGKESDFCATFDAEYYVSLPAVERAVRDRSSFNIVHTPSSFKVDAFVRKERPFERSLMARRSPRTLSDDPAHPIQCVSPEDIILLKLEWYRLGGEVSERQWTDILEVMRVQGDSLDGAYLDRWAAEIGVADLLARARTEAAV
jgi:hypothetical protein